MIIHTQPPVDRAMRDAAAATLRRFLSGHLTNFEFEAALPDRPDKAVAAIWDEMWLTYCDFREHRLTGRFALHPDLQRAYLRCVIFLDTDLPYVWPDRPAEPARPATVRSGLNWLLGRVEPTPANQPRPSRRGRFVWPFVSVADYRHALRNPRRLAGHRVTTA